MMRGIHYLKAKTLKYGFFDKKSYLNINELLRSKSKGKTTVFTDIDLKSPSLATLIPSMPVFVPLCGLTHF
jgi:hypothetical protein